MWKYHRILDVGLIPSVLWPEFKIWITVAGCSSSLLITNLLPRRNANRISKARSARLYQNLSIMPVAKLLKERTLQNLNLSELFKAASPTIFRYDVLSGLPKPSLSVGVALFFFFVLWKHNLLVTLELTFCLWYVRLAPTTLWIGLQPCGGLSTFEPQKACSSRTFSCSASRAIGVATWWRFCRISIALSPRRWQRLQALRAGARRSEWSKRMCAKRSILTIWV